MRDGQDKPAHGRRSKSHTALGLQAAALQKRADVYLIVVVMCGLDLLREPAQKKLRVVLDEDKGLRPGQPPAGFKYRRLGALGRRQSGVIPQRLLRHGVALGMYILQRGEKQQLLGVKKFIERALGYADRLCKLLDRGLAHTDRDAAVPRLADQLLPDRFILFL